jgi:adenosylcobinamide-GDP ribazoletransferase
MSTARSRVRGLLPACSVAFSFLTILPLRLGGRENAGVNDGVLWFPLVGAVVGALAGAVRLVAQPLLGVSVSSVLALIALVALTGALHLDGLADCADGLGVRGNRERRLEVMRDSAVGAFGAVALLGWALLFLSALESLSDVHALRALVAAASLGRWTAMLHAVSAPPARTAGLGAGFHPSRTQLVTAGALAATLAELACGPLPGLAAIGAALLTAALSTVCARKALGGRTGDTLGATIVITEVVVCLALLAVWQG